VFPPFESLRDIRAGVAILGHLVRAEANVATVNAEIVRRVERVQQAVRGRAAPSVLAVFGLRPISVAGRGSFVDELINLAGGRNASSSASRWPTIPLEAVLAMAPQVVLDFTAHDQSTRLSDAWAEYRTIPAVRDGRVVRLADPVMLRPGPRVGHALEILAETIHPDAFTAVAMA